ncbi:hypothetical protein ABVK25_000546 [Lepraria finkii]|uniref:Uncharacterized protein n=1 Tax=Lepraria finkii TaxID=1340010 RepID=A0ABR4BQQ8_9LECA
MKGDPESETNSSAPSGNIQVPKVSFEQHKSQSAIRKAHKKREKIFLGWIHQSTYLTHSSTGLWLTIFQHTSG